MSTERPENSYLRRVIEELNQKLDEQIAKSHDDARAREEELQRNKESLGKAFCERMLSESEDIHREFVERLEKIREELKKRLETS